VPSERIRTIRSVLLNHEAIRPQDPGQHPLTHTASGHPSPLSFGPTRMLSASFPGLFGFLVDPGGPAVIPSAGPGGCLRTGPTLTPLRGGPPAAALPERCRRQRRTARGPTDQRWAAGGMFSATLRLGMICSAYVLRQRSRNRCAPMAASATGAFRKCGGFSGMAVSANGRRAFRNSRRGTTAVSAIGSHGFATTGETGASQWQQHGPWPASHSADQLRPPGCMWVQPTPFCTSDCDYCYLAQPQRPRSLPWSCCEAHARGAGEPYVIAIFTCSGMPVSRSPCESPSMTDATALIRRVLERRVGPPLRISSRCRQRHGDRRRLVRLPIRSAMTSMFGRRRWPSLPSTRIAHPPPPAQPRRSLARHPLAQSRGIPLPVIARASPTTPGSGRLLFDYLR